MTDGLAETLLIQTSPFDDSSDMPHVRRATLPGPEIGVTSVLRLLGDLGIQSLLVEGGVDTWYRFLSSGAVNRARICKSPIELSEGGKIFNTDLSRFGMEKISEEESSGDTITWWR